MRRQKSGHVFKETIKKEHKHFLEIVQSGLNRGLEELTTKIDPFVSFIQVSKYQFQKLKFIYI
jgi:hypothetical protein